jgi:hypothetical protein
MSTLIPIVLPAPIVTSKPSSSTTTQIISEPTLPIGQQACETSSDAINTSNEVDTSSPAKLDAMGGERLDVTEMQDIDREAITTINNDTIDIDSIIGFEEDNCEANTEDNNVKIDESGDVNETFVDDESVQFNFNTASPKQLTSPKDNESQSDDESVVEISSKHRHNKNDCCNASSTMDDTRTYENDEFEWTASCAVINDCLPPSFSGSYLYIRDKSKLDCIYMPGVSIINPLREKRDPEIYLCAVKCGAANNLNFLYAKSADVEAFFAGIINENLSVKTKPCFNWIYLI